MLQTGITFLFVLSSTLVLCKRLHLFNFLCMILKKLPPDFSGGSLRTFISYTILIQHAVFDHIVVTQQFFHYSAFHYAEQRLLQGIQGSGQFDLQRRHTIHQLHATVQKLSDIINAAPYLSNSQVNIVSKGM